MNTILHNRIEEVAENAYPYYKYQSQKKEYFVKGAKWMFDNLWISIEEALPDDDENVLLIFDDGHIIVAYHSGNYWWWCDGFICGTKTNGQPMYSSSQKVDDKPTHWMPIPSLEGGEK